MQTTNPLGQESSYPKQYSPQLLFPIARKSKRQHYDIREPLPFGGTDIWNCYELSWLDTHGKPHIAIVTLYIPCESPYMIESKSLKLYLNSFHQTKFTDEQHVQQTITDDLSESAGINVKVELNTPQQFEQYQVRTFPGTCLDDLPIVIDSYQYDSHHLSTEGPIVEETLHSHLFKSNCPVTNQPDWGSVLIRYVGEKINQHGLLKYLISFRQHQEFHEQCVEHIYSDIMQMCQPKQLTVYARYTRRGGIDINPFRSNYEMDIANTRLYRQ